MVCCRAAYCLQIVCSMWYGKLDDGWFCIKYVLNCGFLMINKHALVVSCTSKPPIIAFLPPIRLYQFHDRSCCELLHWLGGITLHFVCNQITNLCQDGLNFVKNYSHIFFKMTTYLIKFLLFKAGSRSGNARYSYGWTCSLCVMFHNTKYHHHHRTLVSAWWTDGAIISSSQH